MRAGSRPRELPEAGVRSTGWPWHGSRNRWNSVSDSGQLGRESARNRFAGIVTNIIKDKVMAQVEIQSGPFRIVALISREAVDDLGLAPGVMVDAVVKSTNVHVELSDR